MSEVKISEEEQVLILKGIRPEGMSQEVFRKVRKNMNKAVKLYKKGKYKHISVNLDPMYDGSIEVKGTYKREEPRRHEKLSRKGRNNVKKSF